MQMRLSLPVISLTIALAAMVPGRTAEAAAAKAAKAKAAAHNTYRKPSDAELQKKLSPLQYDVTQKAATEPAFDNTYWNNHRAGIYVDIVSGEVLFSSLDKYDSRTGWPSFTRPLEKGNIVLRPDHEMSTVRTEVRSRAANSHLGHVFDDGPAPDHKRYCMNSAALRFVPVANLQAEGYGQYLALFKK